MIDHSMPDDEYHARPELSSTQARDLLDSPHIYQYRKSVKRTTTLAMRVGSATHTKILGTGADVIYYPEEHLTPSGAVSTKAATVEWEKEQEASGKILIGRADAERIDRMSEAILADPDARRIMETITGREVSIFANVEGVDIRARFDMYDGIRGGDLKTTRDASPRGFNREVGQRGYHIQSRWYDDAHEAETGHPLESFTFLAVESSAPFSVGVYELDVMWDDVAAGMTQKARALYRECTETGVWPGYGAQTLTAPTWAVFDADEEEIKI